MAMKSTADCSPAPEALHYLKDSQRSPRQKLGRQSIASPPRHIVRLVCSRNFLELSAAGKQDDSLNESSVSTKDLKIDIGKEYMRTQAAKHSS